MSDTPSQTEASAQKEIGACSPPQAVLTEAVRHIDIVHTSLAGMTAIVVMLLAALALPVFGYNPVTQPLAFWIMAIASFIGIAGLYLLNYRVHQHVINQASLTEVLVNSLGQGFVVFGSDGICESVYSQACLDLLEKVPAGKHIAEVLGVPEASRGDFCDWLDILYQRDHALGFDDVVRFFPQFYPHSRSQRISLVYKPIFGKSHFLAKVVVIVTDQTEEYAAKKAAQKQENFAEMICRIFRDRNQFQTTLAHVRGFLEKAKDESITLKDRPILLRDLHTLKAAVKQFNLLAFGDVIHAAENDLRSVDIRDDASFCARLQESCQKIAAMLACVKEEICGLIGAECEWRGHVREIAESDLYAFAYDLEASGGSPALIEKFLGAIVAVPIRECFHSFERELYELIGFMDKQIKPIKYEGSNPRVLAQPMQEFLFSLTHICRNIADHGIEAPVTRMARGKDAAGQVTIAFDIVKENGRSILKIVISDDGNGIDPMRVREKLSDIDPEGEWRLEDDQTIIQRIFSWGFTTKSSVSALSGRGVGTEAVDVEVKKLGGSIHVSSVLYKGATFEIKLPYKLSL